MNDLPEHEREWLVWNFYKPRHTHSWNMLVLSWRELDAITDETEGWETEYCWENFIIRLWLYRTTIRTLTKLPPVCDDAKIAISCFDEKFAHEGHNGLKAIRDLIEHFDDYAAEKGRGPATRTGELDPWRTFTKDKYERGRYVFELHAAYEAAIALRSDAKKVSDKFVAWYKAQK